jgi:ribosomal protein L18E
VEDYLAFCTQLGQEPDKPFTGRLMLRLSPDLHRRVYIAARQAEKSLNAWIAENLDKKNRRRRPLNVNKCFGNTKGLCAGERFSVVSANR